MTDIRFSPTVVIIKKLIKGIFKKFNEKDNLLKVVKI